MRRPALSLALLTVVACGGDGPTSFQLPSIAVTPDSVVLVSVGESVLLSAAALDSGGSPITGQVFSWTSRDEAVATVSTAGLVTAVANGTTKIRASTSLEDGTRTHVAQGIAEVRVSQEAVALAFTVQPLDTLVSAQLTPSLEVVAEDALGTAVEGWTSSISLALDANPGGASLSGPTSITAVDGVATFANVSVDRPGAGYTLVATAPEVTDVTSDAFDLAPLSFRDVFVSANSSCGITTGGLAYCWGRNVDWQAGDGFGGPSRAIPAAVLGGLSFASIALSARHACGLTNDDVAYCWGEGKVGQLGIGSRRWEPGPLPVSGGFTFVSLGSSCGVANGGAAYCWGSNQFGQLGDGTTIDRDAPVPVSGGLLFVSTSNGSGHACAISEAGAGYCWGYNYGGSLGDGTGAQQEEPVAVAGGLSFRRIHAGGVQAGAHTCGVTTDDVAYCWGFNGAGELGDGTLVNRATPVPVSGGLSFEMISAGGNHSCGVTTDGAAYCWGNNYDGRLGDGTTTSSTVPVPVTGGLTFTSVSAGLDHSCGIAGGIAYCWGENAQGQLGDGTLTQSHAPVRVANQPPG